MEVVQSHPNATDLLAFSNGQLGDDVALLVEEHLSWCSDCCLRLDETPLDSFVERLRQVKRAEHQIANRDAIDGLTAPNLDEPRVMHLRVRFPANLNRLDGLLGGTVESGQREAGCDTRDDLAAATSFFAPPLTLPDYEIHKELGRGGMGIVYRAWHQRLHRFEAVKVLRAGEFASSRELDRFRLEVETAASLKHINIVTVFGSGEVNGQPYLSMECVEGGSLADRLVAYRDDSRACALLMFKTARAIAFAHQHGILHRDLKPANILINLAGEPHIADFGLAKRLDAPGQISQSHTIAGTPGYMAPEQARGERDLTVATDVYALGAVLYSILTGREPFADKSPLAVLNHVVGSAPVEPRRINPRAHPDLEAICLKCLEKNPCDRYASALEVANEFEQFLRGGLVSARPPGVWDWLRQAMRMRPQLPVEKSIIWVTLLCLAALVFVHHTLLFGMVLAGVELGWIWSVHLGSLLVYALLNWPQLRRFRRLTEAERYAIVIGIGHLLGFLCASFAYVPFAWHGDGRQALLMYPALICLSALSLFVQGSILWSRLYLIGAALMPLALVMSWWPIAAPLIYGGSIAIALTYWAYCLTRVLGQEGEKAAAARSGWSGRLG